MSLKMGHKPEIVSANIKEMMKSGHSQKEAIAAAMAMKRKSMKMMADGGMVSDDHDEGSMSDFDENASRSIIEDNALGSVQEADVASPEEMDVEKMFARKLFKASEAQELSGGGMVIGKSQMTVGSKPELDWVNDGSEESMSDEPGKQSDIDHSLDVPAGPGLSEDAKMAIEARKKKRRFMI